MRLGLLAATTTLALPAGTTGDRLPPSSATPRERRGGAVIPRVLDDIRSRMLASDGLLTAAQPFPLEEGHRALWKQRNAAVKPEPSAPSLGERTDAEEPDVGILSHRWLDEDMPDAGTVNDYNVPKFCDLFLGLAAFDNMVCNCQNNPRARVSCQSPKACYFSVDPSVCLTTQVDMAPRPDQATLNLRVCYRLLEPKLATYCFSSDLDYASFFLGNETLYETCELTVDGERCNRCEITSASQNDLQCTGLTEFDCTNTGANTQSTEECSMFYHPFPEITRIDGLSTSDGGGGGSRRSRWSVLLASTVLLGTVLAWGCPS